MREAAAQIPMMRELKDSSSVFMIPPKFGCSPNPYDEGTESLPFLFLCYSVDDAAAQIPMMRELKVPRDNFFCKDSTCCSPNPYDEGTESLNRRQMPPRYLRCCSPNPYDEGTESVYICSILKTLLRCSPNPYDEGTESLPFLFLCYSVDDAAAQIPMMRELKVRDLSTL